MCWRQFHVLASGRGVSGCDSPLMLQAEGVYLPVAPGLYLPGDTSIPGHQLDELALPVDAYQAHILLYTRQLENASSRTCTSHTAMQSALGRPPCLHLHSLQKQPM